MQRRGFVLERDSTRTPLWSGGYGTPPKLRGYRPDTIDRQMVALHALTLLGSEYTQSES
jgi:hypothetical protein